MTARYSHTDLPAGDRALLEGPPAASAVRSTVPRPRRPNEAGSHVDRDEHKLVDDEKALLAKWDSANTRSPADDARLEQRVLDALGGRREGRRGIDPETTASPGDLDLVCAQMASDAEAEDAADASRSRPFVADSEAGLRGDERVRRPSATQRYRVPASPVAMPLMASLHSSGERTGDFCRLVKQLEIEIGIPVWMIVQGDHERAAGSAMTPRIADALRSDLFKNPSPRLAVLLHSPGGSATCAYQLATAFARRRDGFVCIVPRQARSAAALMALGADRIMLGRLGELGPLDAQIMSSERGESTSALDEILALERLQKFALDTLDVTIQFLMEKTKKKVDVVLPMATTFVHGLVHPLFAGIDAARYTQLSRALKLVENYAERLMAPRLGRDKAVEIANRLICNYPETTFAIDSHELQAIGLDVETPAGRIADILDEMVPMLGQVSAIGTVVSGDARVEPSENNVRRTDDPRQRHGEPQDRMTDAPARVRLPTAGETGTSRVAPLRRPPRGTGV